MPTIATSTERVAKTEKSTVTENINTKNTPAIEETMTIDRITTTPSSPTLSGNIVVFDKLYRQIIYTL